MTKPTRTSIGNIPKGIPPDLREFLNRLKQHVEVANQGGNTGMHRFVTIQDLVDLDLADIVRRHGSTAVNSLLNGNIDLRPPAALVRDLSRPPPLYDLQATSTFRAIGVTWDGIHFPTYGHTEIWRAQVDDVGQAVLAGTSIGRIYLDSNVDSGVAYYYWVRAVSIFFPDAPVGPFNAVAGTPAGVGLIGGEDLTDLIITAAKIADGSIDLSGDKITGLLADLNMDVIGDPTKIADGLIGNTKLANLAVTAAKIADGTIDLSGNKITGLLGNLNLAVISDPTKIADSLIGNEKLASAAVTAAKIADGSIDLSGSKITGLLSDLNLAVISDPTKIADSLIGNAKLAVAAVTAAKIADGSIDLGGNKVTGLLADTNLGVISDPTKIADELIGNNKLADLAVDAAKLANSAVTSTKIANLAVGTAAIQLSAITTALIANAAVGSAQIANAAITSAKIADAAIDTAAIQDAAITTALIASLAVGSAQIQDAAITQAKIGSAAVGTAAIQNAAITTALIANLAVGSAQIKDAAITQAKIANLAVDTAAIQTGAITQALIANAAVGSAHIVDAAITEAKIGNLAVGNAAIKNAAITNAKIAALAIDDAHIASLNAVKINAGTLDTNRLNIDNSTLTSVAGVLQLGDVNANSITGGTLNFQNVVAEHLTVADLEGDISKSIPFSMASAANLGQGSTTIWAGQIPAPEAAGIGRAPYLIASGWGVFENDDTYRISLHMRVNEAFSDYTVGTVDVASSFTMGDPPFNFFVYHYVQVSGDHASELRTGGTLSVSSVVKGTITSSDYTVSTDTTTIWYNPTGGGLAVNDTVVADGGPASMDMVAHNFFRSSYDYHAQNFSICGGIDIEATVSVDVELRIGIYNAAYKAIPTSVPTNNWSGDQVFGLEGLMMSLR